jgi:ABC-type transport system involved in multi-copper enzyme maturation permease subunit
MIWLAWRQLRSQLLVVIGVLVVLGVLLALNGSHLVHLYDTTVATCAQHNDCPSVTQNFESQAKWNHALDALVLVVPALIGIFWGAPLVARELETRTNRLAWTQSITRSRWFAVKLAVVGVASVVTASLVSLMVTWWASPYDRLQDAPYAVFDQRDIAPVAYALFAFALGVALGVLIRRTLPAMAATLVAFVAVRFVVSQWIRPRLIAPLHTITPFSAPPGPGAPFVPPGTESINPADLIVSQQTLNRAGRVIGQDGGIGSNGVTGQVV